MAGVYPLLQDETCFFLAVDFDKAGWRDDAAAFLETCRDLSLPAALERSRSGRGAHVWFFFDEAIPAALARRLGSHVLTETMERRPDIGLDSYDRVRKIGRPQVEEIVADAERRGRILGVRLPPSDEGATEPWTAPPSRRREAPIVGELPATLEVVLSNQIYIPKQRLNPGLRNRLGRLAAFQNPEFYRAQAMRLSTYDKPRVVTCAEDLPHHIGLPRGCLEDVRKLLTELGVDMVIRDDATTAVPWR